MAAENDLERLERLDACQLDFMYSMIRLRKGGAVKKDVRDLISYLDDIRQAMIQMTGGEQAQSKAKSIVFRELGTHLNLAIVAALWLRVTGALDELEKILPDKEG